MVPSVREITRTRSHRRGDNLRSSSLAVSSGLEALNNSGDHSRPGRGVSTRRGRAPRAAVLLGPADEVRRQDRLLLQAGGSASSSSCNVCSSSMHERQLHVQTTRQYQSSYYENPRGERRRGVTDVVKEYEGQLRILRAEVDTIRRTTSPDGARKATTTSARGLGQHLEERQRPGRPPHDLQHQEERESSALRPLLGRNSTSTSTSSFVDKACELARSICLRSRSQAAQQQQNSRRREVPTLNLDPPAKLDPNICSSGDKHRTRTPRILSLEQKGHYRLLTEDEREDRLIDELLDRAAGERPFLFVPEPLTSRSNLGPVVTSRDHHQDVPSAARGELNMSHNNADAAPGTGNPPALHNIRGLGVAPNSDPFNAGKGGMVMNNIQPFMGAGPPVPVGAPMGFAGLMPGPPNPNYGGPQAHPHGQDGQVDEQQARKQRLERILGTVSSRFDDAAAGASSRSGSRFDAPDRNNRGRSRGRPQHPGTPYRGPSAPGPGGEGFISMVGASAGDPVIYNQQAGAIHPGMVYHPHPPHPGPPPGPGPPRVGPSPTLPSRRNVPRLPTMAQLSPSGSRFADVMDTEDAAPQASHPPAEQNPPPAVAPISSAQKQKQIAHDLLQRSRKGKPSINLPTNGSETLKDHVEDHDEDEFLTSKTPAGGSKATGMTQIVMPDSAAGASGDGASASPLLKGTYAAGLLQGTATGQTDGSAAVFPPAVPLDSDGDEDMDDSMGDNDESSSKQAPLGDAKASSKGTTESKAFSPTGAGGTTPAVDAEAKKEEKRKKREARKEEKRKKKEEKKEEKRKKKQDKERQAGNIVGNLLTAGKSDALGNGVGNSASTVNPYAVAPPAGAPPYPPVAGMPGGLLQYPGAPHQHLGVGYPGSAPPLGAPGGHPAYLAAAAPGYHHRGPSLHGYHPPGEQPASSPSSAEGAPTSARDPSPTNAKSGNSAPGGAAPKGKLQPGPPGAMPPKGHMGMRPHPGGYIPPGKGARGYAPPYGDPHVLLYKGGAGGPLGGKMVPASVSKLGAAPPPSAGEVHSLVQEANALLAAVSAGAASSSGSAGAPASSSAAGSASRGPFSPHPIYTTGAAPQSSGVPPPGAPSTAHDGKGGPPQYNQYSSLVIAAAPGLGGPAGSQHPPPGPGPAYPQQGYHGYGGFNHAASSYHAAQPHAPPTTGGSRYGPMHSSGPPGHSAPYHGAPTGPPAYGGMGGSASTSGALPPYGMEHYHGYRAEGKGSVPGSFAPTRKKTVSSDSDSSSGSSEDEGAASKSKKDGSDEARKEKKRRRLSKTDEGSPGKHPAGAPLGVGDGKFMSQTPGGGVQLVSGNPSPAWRLNQRPRRFSADLGLPMDQDSEWSEEESMSKKPKPKPFSLPLPLPPSTKHGEHPYPQRTYPPEEGVAPLPKSDPHFEFAYERHLPPRPGPGVRDHASKRNPELMRQLQNEVLSEWRCGPLFGRGLARRSAFDLLLRKLGEKSRKGVLPVYHGDPDAAKKEKPVEVRGVVQTLREDHGFLYSEAVYPYFPDDVAIYFKMPSWARSDLAYKAHTEQQGDDASTGPKVLNPRDSTPDTTAAHGDEVAKETLRTGDHVLVTLSFDAARGGTTGEGAPVAHLVRKLTKHEVDRARRGHKVVVHCKEQSGGFTVSADTVYSGVLKYQNHQYWLRSRAFPTLYYMPYRSTEEVRRAISSRAAHYHSHTETYEVIVSFRLEPNPAIPADGVHFNWYATKIAPKTFVANAAPAAPATAEARNVLSPKKASRYDGFNATPSSAAGGGSSLLDKPPAAAAPDGGAGGSSSSSAQPPLASTSGAASANRFTNKTPSIYDKMNKPSGSGDSEPGEHYGKSPAFFSAGRSPGKSPATDDWTPGAGDWTSAHGANKGASFSRIPPPWTATLIRELHTLEANKDEVENQIPDEVAADEDETTKDKKEDDEQHANDQALGNERGPPAAEATTRKASCTRAPVEIRNYFAGLVNELARAAVGEHDPLPEKVTEESVEKVVGRLVAGEVASNVLGFGCMLSKDQTRAFSLLYLMSTRSDPAGDDAVDAEQEDERHRSPQKRLPQSDENSKGAGCMQSLGIDREQRLQSRSWAKGVLGLASPGPQQSQSAKGRAADLTVDTAIPMMPPGLSMPAGLAMPTPPGLMKSALIGVSAPPPLFMPAPSVAFSDYQVGGSSSSRAGDQSSGSAKKRSAPPAVLPAPPDTVDLSQFEFVGSITSWEPDGAGAKIHCEKATAAFSDAELSIGSREMRFASSKAKLENVKSGMTIHFNIKAAPTDHVEGDSGPKVDPGVHIPELLKDEIVVVSMPSPSDAMLPFPAPMLEIVKPSELIRGVAGNKMMPPVPGLPMPRSRDRTPRTPRSSDYPEDGRSDKRGDKKSGKNSGNRGRDNRSWAGSKSGGSRENLSGGKDDRSRSGGRMSGGKKDAPAPGANGKGAPHVAPFGGDLFRSLGGGMLEFPDPMASMPFSPAIDLDAPAASTLLNALVENFYTTGGKDVVLPVDAVLAQAQTSKHAGEDNARHDTSKNPKASATAAGNGGTSSSSVDALEGATSGIIDDITDLLGGMQADGGFSSSSADEGISTPAEHEQGVPADGQGPHPLGVPLGLPPIQEASEQAPRQMKRQASTSTVTAEGSKGGAPPQGPIGAGPTVLAVPGKGRTPGVTSSDAESTTSANRMMNNGRNNGHRMNQTRQSGSNKGAGGSQVLQAPVGSAGKQKRPWQKPPPIDTSFASGAVPPGPHSSRSGAPSSRSGSSAPPPPLLSAGGAAAASSSTQYQQAGVVGMSSNLSGAPAFGSPPMIGVLPLPLGSWDAKSGPPSASSREQDSARADVDPIISKSGSHGTTSKTPHDVLPPPALVTGSSRSKNTLLHQSGQPSPAADVLLPPPSLLSSSTGGIIQQKIIRRSPKASPAPSSRAGSTLGILPPPSSSKSEEEREQAMYDDGEDDLVDVEGGEFIPGKASRGPGRQLSSSFSGRPNSKGHASSKNTTGAKNILSGGPTGPGRGGGGASSSKMSSSSTMQLGLFPHSLQDQSNHLSSHLDQQYDRTTDQDIEDRNRVSPVQSPALHALAEQIGNFVVQSMEGEERTEAQLEALAGLGSGDKEEYDPFAEAPQSTKSEGHSA
ncbi:unnamed protein product [Amoebophrya sp. A25]|nr:unnamed protein product [Amoebophrya sp. A25]|eukprot:GSA25T00005327001.1